MEINEWQKFKKDLIIKKFEKGIKPLQIAYQLGLDQNVVNRILASQKVGINNNKSKTMDEIEEKKSKEEEMNEVLAQIEKDILEKKAKEEEKSRLQKAEEERVWREGEAQKKTEQYLKELEGQRLAERLEGKLPQRAKEEILEAGKGTLKKQEWVSTYELAQQLQRPEIEIFDLVERGKFKKLERDENTGEILIHIESVRDYLQSL